MGTPFQAANHQSQQGDWGAQMPLLRLPGGSALTEASLLCWHGEGGGISPDLAGGSFGIIRQAGLLKQPLWGCCMLGESMEDTEEGYFSRVKPAVRMPPHGPVLLPVWHRPEEGKRNSPHNLPQTTDWASPHQLRGQRRSLPSIAAALGSAPPQGDPGCAVARRPWPARCQGRAINPQGQSLLPSGSDSNAPPHLPWGGRRSLPGLLGP